jgi:hypothetical protein
MVFGDGRITDWWRQDYWFIQYMIPDTSFPKGTRTTEWTFKEFLKWFRKNNCSLQRLLADSEAKTASCSFGTVGFSPGGSGRSVNCCVWIARLSGAPYRERWNHPAISQVRKLSSACSESATVDRGGYFLYADPAAVIPHCASPLTLSRILVKRQCYYNQFRTCHIDSSFCHIIAADRHITKKVLAFLLGLKLPL